MTTLQKLNIFDLESTGFRSLWGRIKLLAVLLWIQSTFVKCNSCTTGIPDPFLGTYTTSTNILVEISPNDIKSMGPSVSFRQRVFWLKGQRNPIYDIKCIDNSLVLKFVQTSPKVQNQQRQRPSIYQCMILLQRETNPASFDVTVIFDATITGDTKNNLDCNDKTGYNSMPNFLAKRHVLEFTYNKPGTRQYRATAEDTSLTTAKTTTGSAIQATSAATESTNEASNTAVQVPTASLPTTRAPGSVPSQNNQLGPTSTIMQTAGVSATIGSFTPGKDSLDVTQVDFVTSTTTGSKPVEVVYDNEGPNLGLPIGISVLCIFGLVTIGALYVIVKKRAQKENEDDEEGKEAEAVSSTVSSGSRELGPENVGPRTPGPAQFGPRPIRQGNFAPVPVRPRHFGPRSFRPRNFGPRPPRPRQVYD